MKLVIYARFSKVALHVAHANAQIIGYFLHWQSTRGLWRLCVEDGIYNGWISDHLMLSALQQWDVQGLQSKSTEKKKSYYNKYKFYISPHDKWSGIVESLCMKRGGQREVNNNC